jgi:dihydroorotate dehydrogenase
LRHARESGGLSGAPLRDVSTAVIRKLARLLEGRVPIIGAGGVMSADDARAKLDAGASLVQIYTGFIYRGPPLIGEILRALAAAKS